MATMGGMAALASYLLLVIAIVGFLLGITHVLGEKHNQRGMGIPYESGELPTGSARIPFPADFYLIAMFFVIFDASSIFLFAWAVAARELGWAGFAAMLAFLLETAAALAYLWRMGAFDWGKVRGAEHLKRHGLGK
ncbi:MAG: NADH-quinone oxidoreductase subunit A [Rectinemataceae bacterium]